MNGIVSVNDIGKSIVSININNNDNSGVVHISVNNTYYIKYIVCVY